MHQPQTTSGPSVSPGLSPPGDTEIRLGDTNPPGIMSLIPAGSFVMGGLLDRELNDADQTFARFASQMRRPVGLDAFFASLEQGGDPKLWGFLERLYRPKFI